MRKRNHRVEIYFNDDEYFSLCKKVKQSGLTREAFVRECIAGKKIFEAPPADYFELIRQVRLAGNNIDRVLVLAHTKGLLDVPSFKKAIDELRETEIYIREAFGVAGVK